MNYVGPGTQYWRDSKRGTFWRPPPGRPFPKSVLGGLKPETVLAQELAGNAGPKVAELLELEPVPVEAGSAGSAAEDTFSAIDAWGGQKFLDSMEDLVVEFNPEEAERPVTPTNVYVPRKSDYEDSTSASDSSYMTNTESLSSVNTPLHFPECIGVAAEPPTIVGRRVVVEQVSVEVQDRFTQVSHDEQTAGLGNYGKPQTVEYVSTNLVKPICVFLDLKNEFSACACWKQDGRIRP